MGLDIVDEQEDLVAAKTVSLAEIYKVVLDCHAACLERGNGWFAVRVNTDGEVYYVTEARPCYPEGEYFGRQPHIVTIYTTIGRGSDGDIDASREDLDDWLELNVPTDKLRKSVAKAGLELVD